jgi:hypothetical protein
MADVKKFNQKYLDYLQSQEWKDIRLKVLQRDRYRCVDCGAKGKLDVHHTSYKRLFHEDLDDLISLCRQCHESEHKPTVSKYAKRPKRLIGVKLDPPKEPDYSEAISWIAGMKEMQPKATPKPKAKPKINKATRIIFDHLAQRNR